MGIIKRILRETSHRLLSKLGAQRNSRQLVLNQTVASSLPSSRKSRNRLSMSGKQQQQQQQKRRRAKKSAPKCNPSDAILHAVKNNLPPVQFHHVHGPNVLLSKNKCVARRTQSFCQALVFSNRVILPDERVYIKVLEIAKGWSGTIRFGFTSVDPATLRYQMPKHACPDMTNAGNTWARALADEVVRRNSVIHFSYTKNGFIHYGINNQDCGIFFANVTTSQHLWFIVDIYGLTAAVELIDPRIHNAASELDLWRMGQHSFGDSGHHHARGAIHKSTSAINNLVSSSRSKKKRTRKGSRHSSLMYSQWPHESLLMTSPLTRHTAQQGPLLPGLSSFIAPTAQQNIYSPMPGLADRPLIPIGNLNEPHDYYQIMTNSQSVNDLAPHRLRMADISSSLADASTDSSLHAPTSTQRAPNPSTNNYGTTSTMRSASSADGRNDADDDEDEEDDEHDNGERELRRQLKSFQISDIHDTYRSPKSTNALPVAVAKMRHRNNSPGTSCKSKTPTDADPLKDLPKLAKSVAISPPSLSSTSTKLKGSNSSTRTKTTNSIKAQRSSSRDNNNNSPSGKDCPICFERPINCVLYQCGHMCTCYECGVKQWRTQSRTCPICRTIIKDVIKTYMS